MEPYENTWLFVLGIFFAFSMAYGIGANDFANSFSSSVSSQSITLLHAAIIGLFTEFLGAILLGSGTVSTIRGDIIDTRHFEGSPQLLMLGMVCALFGAGAWVIFATSRGWPVSTTHSIVGAIIGVGMVSFGPSSVQWKTGVGRMILSWFLSPIAAGIVTAIIYSTTKYAILSRANSFERGLMAIPVYFGITALINTFYILYNGFPDLNGISLGAIWGIAIGITVAVTIFCRFFVVPWMRRKLEYCEDLSWYHVFVINCLPRKRRMETLNLGVSPRESCGNTDTGLVLLPEANQEKGDVFETFKGIVFNGVQKEMDYLTDEDLQKIHELATRYDNNTEYMYNLLQVVTACMASFAHGSNDVANAAGPLSTIYYTWRTGGIDIGNVTPVPLWILALGGIAIDFGLFTYGYKIMRSLGNQLTFHSPSRGFSIELGSCLTVLTCSKLGAPISTTQCVTGATAAVGLCNNTLGALNWRLVSWCFFSWVLTIPCSALMTIAIFVPIKTALSNP
ncbi:phosphate transporter [Basidiobolus meristosporus CBS 931.73]|uniref:Phosphate transporter n=1 Tax=Basidiobolus meristosporus CBS 931.73 TaxID=1314790 RepID=A0A1Y1YHV2_9FUNG|nr:phosphate transporter [Basidiobolus meristosporus CBS 931.73]|eukprot:ORX97194.1 phosphate transporter [Basidiobolus meristosporus CBS 931.73]